MYIFTGVWSDEYLRYFEQGTAPSLRWPDNRAAIAEAHWIISCREQEKERVVKATEGLAKSFEFIDMELFQGVKHAVNSSFHARRPLLMAPPDTIFSEGSISNLARMASQPNTCIASAHVRVLPSFLNGPIPSSAPDMVAYAWNHLHDSWQHSGTRHGNSVSKWGGVYWQRLGERLIAVQHRLPTVFLANFTQEDINFFNSQTIFGVYDHVWPSHCLMNQQRYRYLGSSDAAFMVEITAANRNVPRLEASNHDEPDAFVGNSLHNWINRQFVSIFRMP